MDLDHTTLLFTRYPLIYRGHTNPIAECMVCQGFACGDGWFDLIDRLSAKVEAHARALQARQATPLPMVVQVKEKLGTLRFRLRQWDAQVARWVAATEAESAHTCELCGQPGKLRHGNLIGTRCDAHAEQSEAAP